MASTKQADNTFTLKFSNFGVGQSPLAHLDSLTEEGSGGHYSSAQNVDVITKPRLLTQGPGLATLTAGTEAGAVDELVNHILDKPPATDVTYGIAATKLHKITPTAVINAGSWPHAISGATSGSSTVDFQGLLYYFYNKSNGGDVGTFDYASTFDDDWGSTDPTGAAALQSAPHPVATKQDIMLFGNGRYVGTYVSTTSTLAPTKLDFGPGTECADVAFHANQWLLAINSGVTSGTNRASGQIYYYDASAISALLSDEAALGVKKIGFIFPDNGVVYVAYQDLSSSGGFALGYLSGRSIKPLRYFTGSLPTFAQKTLYKNTIAFVSSGLIYSCGAVIEQHPVQISQIADGGYSTVGALAAPFGTPMVASSQSTNFKLAQFSGYDTASNWRSIVIPVVHANLKGYIDRITVLTKTLGASARCDLIVEADQASSTSSTKQITTAGKRRHVFTNFALKGIEDMRIFLNWANGSTSNDCAIRQIEVEGHYKE